MNRRQNTFRVDYANVPKKPSFEDVHKFVAQSLGLKREEVERIQCSRTLGCAFVKVSDLEIAQRVVDQHDNKHMLVCDENTYQIRITMEDGAVDVKLSDLSEAVTNEEITQFLSQYGEVMSIRELIWDDKYFFGGISTGVRVVRMTVMKNISSYVKIGGETTNVAYYGQQQTCRHCSEWSHNGISCVQNKKLMLQKTYADAAKQPQKQQAKQQAKQQTKPPPKLTNSSTSTQQTVPRVTDTIDFPELAPAPKSADIKTKEDKQRKSSEPIAPPSALSFLKYTRLQTRTALQMSGGEKHATGDDTDCSTTSTSSKRGKSAQLLRKKLRTDDNDIEQGEEEMQQ